MYVIKHSFTYTDKKEKEHPMECYFVTHNRGFNTMSASMEGAKQYPSKKAAGQDKRKHFGRSNKYSVIKIES